MAEISLGIWTRSSDRGEIVNVLGWDKTEIVPGVKMEYHPVSKLGLEEVILANYVLIFGSEVALGVAAHQVASYVFDKLKNHSKKVKSLTIMDKEVLFDKEAVAKAFLEEIDRLENPKIGSPF